MVNDRLVKEGDLIEEVKPGEGKKKGPRKG
jgi:hypothetical protein